MFARHRKCCSSSKFWLVVTRFHNVKRKMSVTHSNFLWSMLYIAFPYFEHYIYSTIYQQSKSLIKNFLFNMGLLIALNILFFLLNILIILVAFNRKFKDVDTRFFTLYIYIYIIGSRWLRKRYNLQCCWRAQWNMSPNLCYKKHLHTKFYHHTANVRDINS